MSTLLNFAYGSNMLLARLCERVPAARPLGTAVLRGHELRWHKVSQDGSGKCDIIAVHIIETCVFGVVYEIPADQKPALDLAEGLGHGYEEKRVSVQLGAHEIEAAAYFAMKTSAILKPYTWYKALVLAGAIQNNLPRAYIEMLNRAPAIADHDAERHAKNMALAT